MNFDSYKFQENEIQNRYFFQTNQEAASQRTGAVYTTDNIDDTIYPKTTTKKKNRQISKSKREEDRAWHDEETFALIEIWRRYQKTYMIPKTTITTIKINAKNLCWRSKDP